MWQRVRAETWWLRRMVWTHALEFSSFTFRLVKGAFTYTFSGRTLPIVTTDVNDMTTENFREENVFFFSQVTCFLMEREQSKKIAFKRKHAYSPTKN